MPRYLWAEPESRMQRLALVPLGLAEIPYRLGARLHRELYRRGVLRSHRLPPRVIAVGNITVGGSGKTPLVGWLAAELRARGRKVAILSRGVRGTRSDQVNVVSDGERVFLSPAEAGDEPVWLASAAPGVPVLAGRNRVASGLRAAAVFGAEILILDDGFQHHRVERDLDLVCMDPGLGLGNGRVLPRGPLREPPSAMRYADALLWVGRPPDPDTPPPDSRLPPLLPRFRLRIAPRGLRSLEGGELIPLETLRGRRVSLLAAIARPDRLEREIEALGAHVVRVRRYPDHHLYTRRDIENLDADGWWVTTAKDAVKIPPDWAAQRRLLVLEEEVRPQPSERLLDWILERLDRVREPSP